MEKSKKSATNESMHIYYICFCNGFFTSFLGMLYPKTNEITMMHNIFRYSVQLNIGLFSQTQLVDISITKLHQFSGESAEIHKVEIFLLEA